MGSVLCISPAISKVISIRARTILFTFFPYEVLEYAYTYRCDMVVYTTYTQYIVHLKCTLKGIEKRARFNSESGSTKRKANVALINAVYAENINIWLVCRGVRVGYYVFFPCL